MSEGSLDWIYERVLENVRGDTDVFTSVPRSPLEMRQFVEFNLMHTFDATEGHDHFGWHIDGKLGDEKHRTYNINVMLSTPDSFSGGELQVGERNVSAQAGDLYLYPASTPHTVHPLSSGTRRSLVIALTDPFFNDSTRGYWEGYWRAVEGRFASLAGGALADEPKLHLLRGEFLEAQGRGAEAQRAYCMSYRARPADAPGYAQQFLQDGFEVLSAEGLSRLAALERSINFLEMSACISPSPEVDAGLEAVRAAKAETRRSLSQPEHGEL